MLPNKADNVSNKGSPREIWQISLLIWMHKYRQQYGYISEKADGKPCLFICSGLEGQISSANLFGTNAIINISKCQRLSSWLILYHLLFSALKWYSAVLFKSTFSKSMQMHQIQEFPIVFKFLKWREKINNLIPEKKLHCTIVAFTYEKKKCNK